MFTNTLPQNGHAPHTTQHTPQALRPPCRPAVACLTGGDHLQDDELLRRRAAAGAAAALGAEAAAVGADVLVLLCEGGGGAFRRGWLPLARGWVEGRTRCLAWVGCGEGVCGARGGGGMCGTPSLQRLALPCQSNRSPAFLKPWPKRKSSILDTRVYGRRDIGFCWGRWFGKEKNTWDPKVTLLS